MKGNTVPNTTTMATQYPSSHHHHHQQHHHMEEEENLDSIPTIQLFAHHEIHLADALSLEENQKVNNNPEQQQESGGGDPSSSYSSEIDVDAMIEQLESFRVPLSAVQAVKSSEATTHWAALVNSLKRNRAALLSATVHKENRHDKIGLCLSNSQKTQHFLTISSIHEGGLFSQSPFQVGDRLISINTLSCQGMRASVAAQLLRNMTGTVTVVVQNATGDPTLVESMICKPAPNSKTGLSVISNGFSRATIYHINPSSVFCNSLLNRGDLIISINDIPCHSLDSREAAAIVAEAEDRVTVIAERRFESAVVMAAAQ